MIVRCALLILFVNCVRTNEEKPNYFEDEFNYFKLDKGFRVIPYVDNVPHFIGVKKREADGILPKVETDLLTSDNQPQQTVKKDEPEQIIIGQSEGGIVKQEIASPQNNSIASLVPINNNQNVNQEQMNKTNTISVKISPDKPNENVTTAPPTISKLSDPAPNKNITNKKDESSAIDVNSPGVIKRALIVFGGLTLLAVAYLIFYRNKHKKFDASNNHGTGESNQFRYGVLHSDDRRENLELSRIPLTMESDDDEDEDLEIFDLEQKRKSLSYVNLQTNDEDIVLRSSKDESKNNLLLDIEDGSPDQLINWSSSGSKSIL
ncbi:uncharacterized protein LOC119833645 [Zerene cesonia]|uniref:uncharacterized protein LOC119833645 n=1 Tax=Zerene cesonia TaxID=33412 RepID=UPI0018E53C9C|nr:uncharacterized protein LOC119833645 [Zerene cesonia]